MPNVEAFAKEILKALGRGDKKVFHRSTKQGAKLAEQYRQLGPKTLYRFEGPEAKLRAVGEISATEQGNLMHPYEPRGLYFGNSVKDLPDLIEPGSFKDLGYSSTRDAVKNLVKPEVSVGFRLAKPEALKQAVGTDFIRARLLPEAKVLDLPTEEKWNEFIQSYADARLTKKDADQFLKDLAYGDRRAKLANDFTKNLKQEYDAVTFPDVAANQPELTQTVLLNKGKAIGRQGEYYRLLSLGGLFGAAMALGDADEAYAGGKTDLLKRIAKRGLKSVPTKELDELFSEAKNKLYHWDADPEGLMAKGFTARMKESPLPLNAEDPLGLYYAKNKKDLPLFTGGRSEQGGGVIEAIPLRGSKKVVNAYDWSHKYGHEMGLYDEYGQHDPEAYARAYAKFLRKEGKSGGHTWLERDYDWDDADNEVIQLKAKQALAKYGGMYKVLSAAGLAGAGTSLFSEDEAEASPIGDLLKGSSKMAKQVKKAGIPSRTAKFLKGTEFRGRKITDVLKVDDDWRHIHLDDGTVYPVTKDVASNLVRRVGTEQKMVELGTKNSESKLSQALKSLLYHETRSKATSRQEVRQTFHQYLKQLEDAGVAKDAVPYSLVERGGKEFTLPREYADILAREGHVRVIEGKELLQRPAKSGRKLQLWPWGRKD